MDPTVKEFPPPPQSPRTARYRYIPQSPNKDLENMSPEEVSKRNSLHEKFVQKLGSPESVATAPSVAEVPGEDENEDDDEEEMPASKTLRGKYTAAVAKTRPAKSAVSSTVKLTPLERQYVEIKKKYPNTLLLIEVGYKFRFFGEDARVSPTHPNFG
jgi:DNA mismatch repair protein MSH3